MLSDPNQNPSIWILLLSFAILIAIASLVLIIPRDTYLKAGNAAFYKLPPGAYDVSVHAHLQGKLEELYKQGKLLYFVGETETVGLEARKDVARLKAYQQFAEYLDSKVSVFKRLVEGQIASYSSRDVPKENLVSVAEAAFLSVTQLVAAARISGLLEYASWKYRKDSREVLAVLVFLDPDVFYSNLEEATTLKMNLSSLKATGIEFKELFSAALFDKNMGTEPVVGSRSSEILSAVGEGADASEEKAEDIAKKDALSKLAEQVYVSVETESRLRELFRTSASSTGRSQQEELETEYEKIVKVVSAAGLYGVKYTVLDTRLEQGRHKVRVKAEIPRSVAIQDFTARVVVATVQSLIDRKLLFTCNSFLQSVELSSFEKTLPSVQQMLVQLGVFQSTWRRAKELFDAAVGKSIRTLDDALEVGNLISELETICADYPDTLSGVKSQVEQWTRNFRPAIIVQRHVWMNEKVKLKLKYPSSVVFNKIALKLNVVGKNCKPDAQMIDVRYGEGFVWVSIETDSPEVQFRFGGTTIATWRPERVFKTSSQVESEKISSAAVVFAILGNERKSEVERRLSHTYFSLLNELLKGELARSSSLEIAVLDSSFIEATLGRMNFSDFDTLFRTLREQRVAKYLVVPSFSFMSEKYGSLLLLKISADFRIADLMTGENWTVTLYVESLGQSGEEALRSVFRMPEFRADFSRRVVELLRF